VSPDDISINVLIYMIMSVLLINRYYCWSLV